VIWDFENDEINIEDYTALEGSITNDQLSAEWTVNSLQPDTNTEVAVYRSNWEQNAEDEIVINSAFLEDGEPIATIDFTQDGVEHTLVFENDNSGVITVFWNTSTQIGYIEDSSGRRCWDGSLNDTPC
jgi:hypothetical protein